MKKIRSKNPFILLLLMIGLLFPLPIVDAKEDKPGEVWIRVDLWKHKLYVMQGKQVKAQFPVGIGKEKTPTPIGKWFIVDKGKNWGGGFGPCWLGLNVPWGRFGIHGTNKPYSVGEHSSHGCLRILNANIKKIYKMVPLGSKVIIEGPLLGANETEKVSRSFRGQKGTLVLLIQNRLYHGGYYKGDLDGIFGRELEKAVLQFQKDHGLEKDGQVYIEEYLALGLLE
ncbi:L,D-transpeptidase family protein [Thermoactinomyces sp. AMNI-1]|uniref:L,D-transpeptidase family protein n=2 Tax=Thermoactinomyces mirandus TaxID=2756294 RepID=A0A7W1XPZ7_9BACL|nr:L,D-transpeptidase family protein [Thermoactinomyces mirandus]